MKRAVILTKCINKFMIYGVGNRLIARYRGGENQMVREPHLFKHCYVIYRILHANQKTMLCAKSCTQKLVSKHIFNSLFSLVILLSSNNQFRYILVWRYLFAIVFKYCKFIIMDNFVINNLLMSKCFAYSIQKLPF